MSTRAINEQTILEELRRIPQDRWEAVLTFLRSLQRDWPAPPRPILSGADLVDSDLIGIWADRTDIKDSRDFARQLRHQAEHGAAVKQ